MRKIFLTALLLLLTAVCGATEVMKVSGRVTCGGKGLPGVVVTDGENFAVTDAKGRYAMQSHTESRFVWVTTPAGYESPVIDGVVRFFLPLEKGRKSYDFPLNRKALDDTRHGFIAVADPQVLRTSEFSQLAVVADDIAATVAQYPGVPFHGMNCGDITCEDHGIYAPYNSVMERSGLPYRNCMGNHDMKLYGPTFESSLTAYEQMYGPAWYSYNVGKVHYVVLDNTFYIGAAWYYIGYLDEKQLEWLKKDLSYVPEGSTVVVTMHIPTTFEKKEELPFDYGKAGITLCNDHGFYKILEPYNTHIVSGHMHTTYNAAVKPNLYEHNIAAACGAWWQGKLCTDGTPRGYGVFLVDGDSVQWYYKGADYPKEHQMRLFSGREHPRFEGYVVANVWNADPSWKVELWEDGVNRGRMERFTATDPAAEAMYADKDKLYVKWISVTPAEHFYRAAPTPGTKVTEVVATDLFGNVYRARLGEKSE